MIVEWSDVEVFRFV